MSKAPITLDTELFTTDESFELRSGLILPEGSSGHILELEDDRALIEWCYCFGSTPWATENYSTEWVDLDDWGVWNYFGFEETEEA